MAQGKVDRPGDPSSMLVASARTKPTSSRMSTDVTATKAVAVKKEPQVATKKAQKPIGRIWGRLMGICHEIRQVRHKS